MRFMSRADLWVEACTCARAERRGQAGPRGQGRAKGHLKVECSRAGVPVKEVTKRTTNERDVQTNHAHHKRHQSSDTGLALMIKLAGKRAQTAHSCKRGYYIW